MCLSFESRNTSYQQSFKVPGKFLNSNIIHTIKQSVYSHAKAYGEKVDQKESQMPDGFWQI